MQYRNPYFQASKIAPQPRDETVNLANACEFIKEKLYFVSVSQIPASLPNVHFFSIDQQFVYTNFYADFGPSNMSHVVRFCNFMQQKFDQPDLQSKILCLYSSNDIDKRANAAFLICAYMVLVYKRTPEEAYQNLMGSAPPFVPYRDAGYGPATYHITILDCIRGLYKAMQTGLFNIDKFDVDEYEFYEKVENGDYNWITNKFLALAAPKDDIPGQYFDSPVRISAKGKKMYSAYRMTNLVKWMVENNIKTIIRLNNKTYEKKQFVDAGIEHIELYFPDGSTPPDMILKRFLEVCESRPGPIAVHCKAGLGRTGTLIASYLMKHYRLTACEVISFMRIIRPGSVVGPQQNYLQAMQPKLWNMTPQTRLPSEISCWNPPGSLQVTRFGPAKFAWRMESHPPLPNDSFLDSNNGGFNGYGDSAIASAQASRREVLSIHNAYGDVREYERELARERSTKTTRSEIEELAIPIQPRKHLVTQPQPSSRPVDPSWGATGWRQDGGSAYQSKTYQQQFNHPTSILQNSHAVPLQDHSSTRYHLRSQSANNTLSQTIPRNEVEAFGTNDDKEMEIDQIPELSQI